MRTNLAWYVADFETTSYETYLQEGKTRVWLYAICDSEGTIVNIGQSLDEFMEYIKELHGCRIYFHNEKFDGSFILNWLFEHNFPYVDKLIDKKCFSALIGQEGQFYNIKISFGRHSTIEICDSLKLLPISIKELAKALKLEVEKGKIDYNDYIVDENTIDYVSRDVIIASKGIKIFIESGLTKLTIGANSYGEFKKQNPQWKTYFPMLSREWLTEWRQAYRGGRSQVNPKYSGKILNNVYRFDINSMYPYIMHDMYLPYGKPIKLGIRGLYKFELYKVDISFKLKKGHLPTLLRKGFGFMALTDKSYYEQTDGIETIYISNIDYELLVNHYDIFFIEFKEIYGFKTTNNIFKSFIDKYYQLKQEATGGLRLLYKLILNNLYGKFGSNCSGRRKIPRYDENGLYFENSDIEDMPIYYLPVAIAITSYAHKLIDDAIMTVGYDNFVYCDTDSVHSLKPLPNYMIDSKELGKFKLEAIETKSKYLRQKCYITSEIKKGIEETNITCSGMTRSIKEYLIKEHGDNVYNIFDYGLTVDEKSPNIKRDDLKLRPVQVKGGVVLKPVPFTLKER